MFFFLCRILGLCLLQNELCPITLNRHVIKVLLGRKVRGHHFYIRYCLSYMMEVLRTSLTNLLIISGSAG